VHRRTQAPVIDLMHDVPGFDVRAAAYLLDALQRHFERGDVFVTVVDPGVGGDRAPVMVLADGKWYVGPDNGLLGIVCRRAEAWECRRIDWRPDELSVSFHGRDLFAPAAAMLATGEAPSGSPWTPVDTGDWPDELEEIIYLDDFGNAMTGIRADALSPGAIVEIKGRRLRRARTFSQSHSGQPFWYRNSVGLVEIALNRASAAGSLGLAVGDPVRVRDYERLLGRQAGD
jgi:hypothetical protein